MTKKYLDFLQMVQFVNYVLKNTQEASKAEKKLIKISELLKPYLDDYNSKRDEIMLDYALEENGRIQQKENGSYEYSKEDLRKRDKDLIALYNGDFEFTPIAITRPDGLELYTFLDTWVTGVVFVKQDEETI